MNFLLQYQKVIADQLRVLETKRAKGDPQKLLELTNASDGELVVKWLWVISIVGVPSCFLAVPFVLSLFGPFIWSPIKSFLWITADTAMIIVFTIFLFAVFFTTRRHDV
ncbi:MAG: hypothetical protein P4L53_21665 [Candidatus Obscuribacterales bacterium]|nr:hypothetical protein [Candidatus Obscuribacterales bacterium]